MFHPIFSVLIKKPDLVIEHLSAYLALAKEEAGSTGVDLAQRLVAWAVAGVASVVFLTLAGVAVMLGVLMDRFSWALVLVPGLMMALAVIALASARKPMPPNRFAEVKRQIDADMHALRAAGDQS
jgi:MFS family permease